MFWYLGEGEEWLCRKEIYFISFLRFVHILFIFPLKTFSKIDFVSGPLILIIPIPESDKAVEIVDALHNFLKDSGVKRVKARIVKFNTENNRIVSAEDEDGNEYVAEKYIIATVIFVAVLILMLVLLVVVGKSALMEMIPLAIRKKRVIIGEVFRKMETTIYFYREKRGP